ncbi:thioesterase II family protein [Micromonospora sp. CA-246542]|uniref:thioesterase II family protein n=1 Tax=Micromonospora sp. CA-246542 TaxID=3239959 RepID=UPI003D91F695
MSFTLVCFPFAGAGASIYRPWQSEASSRFQLLPVQLPGREERFLDEPFRTMSEAAAACADMIGSELNGQSYAVFGHSFGAILAYETVRLLSADRLLPPTRLIVSGAACPQRRPNHGVSQLGDDELVSQLESIVGYRHDAFADPDLREVLLPALRADLTVTESYRHSFDVPLSVPVTVLRGVDDTMVPRDDIAGWADITIADCEVRELPGGHMYLVDDWTLLWKTIDDALSDAG